MNKSLVAVANRLEIEPQQLHNVIMRTVMPSKQPVTEEQFTTFIAIANEYNLNPLTKEVYAFPGKQGALQIVVSVDGWLRIINTHPQFNGMTFEDRFDDHGNLVSVTCSIYKKDILHPIQVTEYMSECRRDTEPWRKWPARMLRHKSTIQAGRYAFGLSGIVDPDEAERYEEQSVIDMGKAEQVEEVLPEYPQEKFIANYSKWKPLVDSGKQTPDTLIDTITLKYALNDAQIEAIFALGQEEENNEKA